MYAASAPLNRVLSGTITPPAAYTPSAACTHSVVLGAQIATRSPGCTPVAINARADVTAASASCGNVMRSRSSTSASISANSRAARSTMAGMVWGRASFGMIIVRYSPEGSGGMAESGQITDEGIARLRARIGVPEPHPLPPYYTLPTVDTFRNVAVAYGDDNPLWCDPDYGLKTRWDGVIAPPPLVGGDTLVGEDEVPAVAPEHKDLMKGDPLRGVHAFYAASAREWWAPLYPQRRVFRRNALVAAFDKESEFAGRAVHEWTAQVFRDETGTILSGQYRNMIRTECEK